MERKYDLDAYVKKIKGSSSYFHTFINKQNLAAGVLVLRPGEEDTQEPHDTDEVYLILSGNGFLKINGKDYEITRDRLFFVKRGEEHCFYGNTKELKVLYFFGGPDS